MSESITTAVELTPEHPPEELSDLASHAEKLGYDAVFASHHYFNRDPFQVLAHLSGETDEIALGPGVVNPYETHPVTLAARMATLDELSDGRAVFGIGAGDPSALAALGIEHDRPLARVHQTVEVARSLWAGERVTHEGVITAQDAELNMEPRSVPVYVGAQGPQMLRMAAETGEGVLINAAHPRDLEWAAEQLAAAEGTARRLAFASVSVAEEGAAAREAARPPVAFIAGAAAPPVLERHGIDQSAAEAVSQALEAGDLSRAFGAVTPAMIEAFCVAGAREPVSERLEAMLEHVDGIVVGSPLGPDRRRALELAGEALADAGCPPG